MNRGLLSASATKLMTKLCLQPSTSSTVPARKWEDNWLFWRVPEVHEEPSGPHLEAASHRAGDPCHPWQGQSVNTLLVVQVTEGFEAPTSWSERFRYEVWLFCYLLNVDLGHVSFLSSKKKILMCNFMYLYKWFNSTFTFVKFKWYVSLLIFLYAVDSVYVAF